MYLFRILVLALISQYTRQVVHTPQYGWMLFSGANASCRGSFLEGSGDRDNGIASTNSVTSFANMLKLRQSQPPTMYIAVALCPPR
jgi:hypothetical protein